VRRLNTMGSHDESGRAMSLRPGGGSDAAGRSGPALREVALSDLFDRLVAEWRDDTQFVSSVTEIALSPAYQKIIGLGPAVLPFLFKQLRQHPDYWFWALKAITREDPVPEEAQGNLPQMTEAWLGWAQSQGFAV
jgi:hypothetical protein